MKQWIARKLVRLATVLIGMATAVLSGCATPTVQFKDRLVEVDKPIAIQPIKAADVPAVPAPLGARPPTVQQQEDALLSKVCEFVAYALKADPLLRVSAGVPQAELKHFPECERH